MRKGFSLKLIMIAAAFLLAVPLTHAKAPQGFSQKFGLLVHQSNQGRLLNRSQAAMVIQRWTGQTMENPVERPSQPVTRKEFLENFFQADYKSAWAQARRMNWLAGTEMTYANTQEFLYRASVSRAHHDRPYFEGLVLDPHDINSTNYSENEIDPILSRLFREIVVLTRKPSLSPDDTDILKNLKTYQRSFKVLDQRFRSSIHPFNIIKNLPDDIYQKIAELRLNEVLGQIQIDLSSNPDYRKHNVITGLMKLNGKVYLPGEVIDFLKAMDDENWSDFQMGKVIFENKEDWQYAGGVCGASSMIFSPAWKAGLEILERNPHTIFYKELYGPDQIGLEAAIFRGGKNLRIRNNTDSPILYVVKYDEAAQKVTVYLVGNARYRSVKIEGPRMINDRTVAWVRQMTEFSGKVIREELTTTYDSVR